MSKRRPASGWSQWFVLLLAGLLVSLFAGILTSSTPVFAADATWDGAKLKYNNETYSPINDSSQSADLGLGSSGRSYGTSSTANGVQEFRVIHFSSVEDLTTATSAEYIVYDFTPPNNFKKKSSSTITTDPAGANSGGLQEQTSCDVAGIGWIVCPVSNWLATGMDWLYEQLDGFLSAQPLNITDQTSGQYIAWKIMLGIANVLFIAVFIIIIYSHITSLGVSNYGIKKMFPRLIIAAIMVNLSFYICALAIDLSNIAGHGLQDMFIQIRNTMTTAGASNGGDTHTWESVTAAILSGGAAVGAGGAAFFMTYSGVTSAALIMLLPLLLGLLVTVIVVLLVLAARQALIVILTIISPLAFLCYLLPGTEKWFEKWRSLFFTMLIFFPAFSAVFGGAQLAGAAILQNANSIVMAILGLGVQVAPLAIAPLILKLSGGLLNRFAGVINNPSKGMIDKTRNWAEQQSQYLANRRSRGRENLPKWAFNRRIGRAAYRSQERRKERIANYQSMAEASYLSTAGHAKLDTQKREIEQTKQLIEKQLDVRWNAHVQIDTKAMEKDLKLRVTADKAELGKARLDNRYEEFKAGTAPEQLQRNTAMLSEMRAAQETTRDIAVESLRKNNAQRVLNSQLAEEMLRNQELQTRAGGIYMGGDYGTLGADAAVASAINTMRSEYGKSVEEGRQIVKHFNLSSEQRQKHALGESVEAKDSAGNIRTFSSNNTFTREAVIEDQIAVGTVAQVKEIVQASGGKLAEYKTTISEAVAKSGVKGKAPFMGGKLIDEIAKGTISSEDKLLGYIQDWIADGKYRDEDIAITDPDGLKILMKAATSSTQSMSQNLRNQLQDGLTGLSSKAAKVLDEDELNRHVSKKAQPLMEKISRGDFTI